MTARVRRQAGVKPAGAREARRPGVSSRRIDLYSLKSEGIKHDEIPTWQNDEDAATLHWTRKIGEGGARNALFKVVGIPPSARRGTSGKPSKLTTRWKISNAQEKWGEDPSIVYIGNVYLDTFQKHFPNSYSDVKGLLDENPQATIPIFIAGPRDQVIRTLEHQLILPAGSVDGDLSDAAENWIDDVAITSGNYQQVKKEEFDEFLALDEEVAIEKAVDLDLDVGRISDILWVASVVATRGKKVELLDVNNGYIGKYGGVLEKPVNNVFTDYIVSRIRKGMTEFKPMSINITSLAVPTKDSKPQTVKTEITRDDISEGKYGATQRRPIDVDLTIHVDNQAIKIPRYTISTAEADAVLTLFNEIEAVNKARPEGIYYTMLGNKEAARSNVAALLQSVKPRGAAVSREKGPNPDYTNKAYGKQ